MMIGCILSDEVETPIEEPIPELTRPNDISESRFINRAGVDNDESIPDERLTTGEVVKPSFAPLMGPSAFKPDVCSADLVITTEACLMELQPDGTLVPTIDANGNVACSIWDHDIGCDFNNELFYRDSDCRPESLYCQVTLSAAPSLPCGWQLTTFLVKDAESGRVIEEWTQEAVEQLLFRLLQPGQ